MVSRATGFAPSPPVKLCSTVKVCACAAGTVVRSAVKMAKAVRAAILARKLLLKIEAAICCCAMLISSLAPRLRRESITCPQQCNLILDNGVIDTKRRNLTDCCETTVANSHCAHWPTRLTARQGQ